MKQTRSPRPITAKIYREIDVEVRGLVRLLNKVDGVATLDSCFGHSSDKRGHTNQLYLYIGVHKSNHKKFMDFFAFLLKHTYGGGGMVFCNRDLKFEHLNTGFAVRLQTTLYPSEGKINYQLVIEPMNQAKARREKLAGVKFVSSLIREYLKLGPKQAARKLVDLKAMLAMIRRQGFNPGVSVHYQYAYTKQLKQADKRKRRQKPRSK